MPTKLRNLKITRVDLVDKGANQDDKGDGSHILLFKRAPDESDPQGLMARMLTGIEELKALFKSHKPEEDDTMAKPKELKDMTPQELLKHAEEQAETLSALQKDKGDLETKVGELENSLNELKASLEKDDKQKPGDDDVLKGLSPEVRKILTAKDEAIKKAQEAAEAAQKVADEEREQRVTKQYQEEAETFTGVPGEPATLAKILRGIDEGLDKELVESFRKSLKTMSDIVVQSELFKQLGNRGDEDAGTAQARLLKIAKGLREKDASLTAEQAYAQAANENPDLVVEMRNGN